MVINRKYGWKPGADTGKTDRIGRNSGSFTQTGFKQILETSGRSVSRGAKGVAARFPGVEIAQDLLKTAMNSATVAIPRQLESLRGLSRLLPSTIRPPASTPKPEPQLSRESAVQEPLPLELIKAPRVSEEPSDSRTSSTVESETDDAEPVAAFDTEPEHTASPPDSPFDAEPEQKQYAFESYPDAIPDVACDEATSEVDSQEHSESAAQIVRFTQEPPRTRFMARRLASQGYTELALSIYDQLLSRDRDDQKLRKEADEIRSGQPVFDSAVELPNTLLSASCIGSMDKENRISALESNRDELTISWSVTPKGVQRAQSVLGEPGELCLRIFEVCSDPDAIVRTRIIEHCPVKEIGSWTARGLSIGCRRAVAIGLRADRRFAAVTHVSFTETSAVSD